MDPVLLQKVQALMQEIYEAGRRDGGAAMREAILKAAEVPVQRVAPKPISASKQDGERAPRGLLPQVMAQVLRQIPGSTEQEIAEMVTLMDSRISPRSVGGQLRRFRGKVYRQEGRKWFLLETVAAGSSREPADLL